MHNGTFDLVLVEDNSADVFLLERAFRGAGLNYRLRHFEDGDEALAFARSAGENDPPDAVLLDLNLPKASGREILEAIRGSRCLHSVQAIVLTSSQSREEKKEVEDMGAEFISKPRTLDEFMAIGETVKMILERIG